MDVISSDRSMSLDFDGGLSSGSMVISGTEFSFVVDLSLRRRILADFKIARVCFLTLENQTDRYLRASNKINQEDARKDE